MLKKLKNQKEYKQKTSPEIMENIEIKMTKNGKGVFAKRNFDLTDIIEKAPVIKIKRNEIASIKKTVLNDYYFLLPNKSGILPLGLVLIYNHSYKPNAEYIFIEDDFMLIKPIKEIVSGEQITINYNGENKDKSKLWFKVNKI